MVYKTWGYFASANEQLMVRLELFMDALHQMKLLDNIFYEIKCLFWLKIYIGTDVLKNYNFPFKS